MENIIEEVRQYHINLLKETEKNKQNEEIKLNQPLQNKGNPKNINNNKSKKLSNSYFSIKYKPIFQKEKNLNKNKKPKRKYETFVIENSKDNLDISNFMEEIKETQRIRAKEKRYLDNKNKALLWYDILSKYDSYNKDNENKDKTKSITKEKNTIINKKDELVTGLDKMHELINQKRDMTRNENKKIKINNYQDVLDNIMKEIEMVRKQRQIENDIFQKQIELLERNIMYNEFPKYKTPKKQKVHKSSIYLSNKSKKKYGNNKFNTAKKDIQNRGRFISYNNNKNYNKYNNNIHKKINYMLNKYNYSFKESKKYMPNYIKKKLKEENSRVRKNNDSPEINFYKKILNQIKKLNKENEMIKKKYKYSSILNKEINEFLLKKLNNTAPIKKINYRKNRFLINKNINTISRKIIDDLLYELIYDLMIIDSKNPEKNKLISGFNKVCENLNLINIEEQNIISKYDNIIEEKLSKTYKNNFNFILKKKKKIKVSLNEDFVKRIDINKDKRLENMILNGCFYSDFNIFEIYDQFVDEQINFILEDEINYIVNKYDILVEKICNDEIKKTENQFNEP